MRNLARTDLYFLLRYVLNRSDMEHPWILARCWEVNEKPDGYLDLWAREHYKSTIITFGRTIQDILRSHGENPVEDREATIGIFSFSRGIALDFVRQIQFELENNELLKWLFPDILYANPQKEAPVWSLQGGLVVRRQGNPKEATVEGWGLVDSMPTGRHFTHRIYDDVITERFARSPDMIRKSTESWELSLNLGARGGISRYIGTRYHTNDTYRTIMERKAAIPRIYTATENGQIDGKPVLLTPDELSRKRREMGPFVFGAQMMQDPQADEIQGFKIDWLNYWQNEPTGNCYLIVDPASEKKKSSDYTAMFVIRLGMDRNYYVVDMIRDRLNLTERAAALFALHRKYQPIGVGYEKYGMQADIEHMQDKMERENYRFHITPLGGQVAKVDRIRRLIPLFEQGRIWLPQSLPYRQYDGRTVDLVESFIRDEYETFPVGAHDDMLDCLARIVDPDFPVTWPRQAPETRYTRRRGSFMSR